VAVSPIFIGKLTPAALLEGTAPYTNAEHLPFFFGSAIAPLRICCSALCGLCAALTLVSGYTYFQSCRDLPEGIR
jgi:hypothetical protein